MSVIDDGLKVDEHPGNDLAPISDDSGSDDGNPAPEPLDPDWPYERFEYKGDNLAVRKATLQALMAYQVSGGKYMSPERQNNATGKFCDMHIGPDSYDRMMERMLDPDDPDYTKRSFAEITGHVVRISAAAIKEEVRAEKERAALESRKGGNTG